MSFVVSVSPTNRRAIELVRSRCRRTGHGASTHARGVTLIELVLVMLAVAILGELAHASYELYRERSDVAHAARDIAAIAGEIARYAQEHQRPPDSLADLGRATSTDPWGNTYRYVNHRSRKGNGQWRRDANDMALNTDFDLYSLGKDGDSQPPLAAAASRDDVVRAHDGRFIGIVAGFER